MTIPSLEQPKIKSAPLEAHPDSEGSSALNTTTSPSTPLPQVRSKSPLQRWSRRIAWTLLFTGTALSAAVAGALVATTAPLPGWLGGSSSDPLSLVDLWQSGFRYRVTRPVNILLLGVDEVPEATPGSEEVFSGRTDTMLLTRFDSNENTLSILSIPRDTRVEVPGDGIAKINHANIVGGPEKVAETIQSNLGPVAIDRYVRVNTEGVRELIDLIGGVEVYVPQPMVYEDKTQGLYINLQPGWQTLNGDQAEQFARFRSDGQGDIGRVQRQQILLQALRERLMSPRVIPQLPQMIRVMLRYIDTNLSLEEILALANFSMELGGTDNLRMVMLPGRFSTPEEYIASYWLIDPQASQQVMNEFFQLDTVALLSNTESRAVSQLRIAVQNASDVTNSAQAVARTLRQQGFSNVYVVPAWSGTVRRTEVIAQRGDLNSAQVVQSVLGTGSVVSNSTGDLQSDLTIRVGEDWSETDRTGMIR